MALILRNGGSQSPDRWLRDPRNNHKTIAVKVRTSKIHVSQQSKKTSNTWKIVGENVRVVKPEELVNKEIYLRRGRKRVKGVVLEVKPLGKGPEGKPVPTPPPDLD